MGTSSYHLVATHVRIWKIKPGTEDLDNEGMGEGDSEETKWTATSVADFDQHQ